jgi:hypothetical protein
MAELKFSSPQSGEMFIDIFPNRTASLRRCEMCPSQTNVSLERRESFGVFRSINITCPYGTEDDKRGNTFVAQNFRYSIRPFTLRLFLFPESTIDAPQQSGCPN